MVFVQTNTPGQTSLPMSRVGHRDTTNMFSYMSWAMRKPQGVDEPVSFPCETCSTKITDEDQMDICDSCAEIFCVNCVPEPVRDNCTIFAGFKHMYCSNICQDMPEFECKKTPCRYKHAAHMKPSSYQPPCVQKMVKKEDEEEEVDVMFVDGETTTDGASSSGEETEEEQKKKEGQAIAQFASTLFQRRELEKNLQKKKCEMLYYILTGRELVDTAWKKTSDDDAPAKPEVPVVVETKKDL